MTTYKILVFPCGSEIGLELQRSLDHLKEIDLWGASSVDDHGRFVYRNYIPDLPFVTHPDFLNELKAVVSKNQFDAIYPATDLTISILKQNENFLGCKVIASPPETTAICLDKSTTYNKLDQVIKTPVLYDLKDIKYPCFVKPRIGYGSRGAKKIINEQSLNAHLAEYPDCVAMNYLPGEEYTVDCFTKQNGELMLVLPRTRSRIMNGISVHTKKVISSTDPFLKIAESINRTLNMNGSWFFQVKRDDKQELTLLEVASRIGGSSSLWKLAGINLPLLSIFNEFGINVRTLNNNINIEMDRSLNNAFKMSYAYNKVYIDFDDCIIINHKINTNAVKFIHQCINKNIKVTLLTRHSGDINNTLQSFRIRELFDEIIHLKKEEHKSSYIPCEEGIIFIDDSFSERKDVAEKCGIPTFGIESIACLINE